MKNTIISIAAVLSILLFLSTSCIKEPDPIYYEPFDSTKQAQIDDSLIRAYLIAKNIEAIEDTLGLYYHVSLEGNGIFPTPASTVEVFYKGYLLDGTVFGESTDSTIFLDLNKAITGWQLGIPNFSLGGNGTLFLPSALGYGPYQNGSLPASSVLIFDINLIDLQ
ncbi:MAG: FKBP-type peptidyl-prolyl cis-trans isomerase [Salinivirgaceae bacterium]|jgi:FKBP-type peptidyl-prolyl cis-trans isomerase FkpA|nr:FKBP-type peptidyl-prolyl cis-trans isomerase [Salinivirgaceae bacterium]